MQDIKHHAMMEELALAAKLSIAEMQNHASLLINAFDKEHRVLFWNNRCEQHFGLSKEQVLGKKLEDILPWTRHHERTTYIERALMGQEINILNERFQFTSGHYEQRVIPVRNKDGVVIAALNLVKDMPG
jgi:PAS domain S-box-containing protein